MVTSWFRPRFCTVSLTTKSALAFWIQSASRKAASLNDCISKRRPRQPIRKAGWDKWGVWCYGVTAWGGKGDGAMGRRGAKGPVIGRGKNSARPGFFFYVQLAAPVLSRAVD